MAVSSADLDAARIPHLFRGVGIDGMRAPAGSRTAASIKVVRVYIGELEERSGAGLMLLGPVGTGKTRTMCTVGQAAIERGMSTLYATAGEAVRLIRSSWRKDSTRSEPDAWARLIDPDLLLLDEIGLGYASDGERMILGELIDARYRNAQRTLLATNCTASELTDYIGERAFDRLAQTCQALVFDGPSHRRSTSTPEGT